METEQELGATEVTNDGANDPFGEADLKERVRLAARVAAEAGEFKNLAFEKVLDRLLGTIPTAIQEDPSQITPRFPLAGKSPRRPTKRLPKASTESLERIKPVMSAPGEAVGEWAVKVEKLAAKYRPHAVLAFARDNGMDGLTTGEIRHILFTMFRIGMPDSTLRAVLSKAPPTEISRAPGEQGETIHRVLRAGEEAFKKALAGTENGAKGDQGAAASRALPASTSS